MNAALAADGADPAQIEAIRVTVADVAGRYQSRALAEPAEQVVGGDEAPIAGRRFAHPYAPLLQILPWVVIGRKLAGGQHNLVPRLPGQPAGHGVDAVGGACGQGNLRRTSADELRHQGPGLLRQLDVEVVADSLRILLEVKRP